MKVSHYALMMLFASTLFSCTDKNSEETIIIDDGNNTNQTKQKTANDNVPDYTDSFIFGMNMGYKNGSWSDTDIADIFVGSETKGLEGVGAIGLRPSLPETFVERYGYGIRVNEFNYYTAIGARINTLFIGDSPSDAHREQKTYTSDESKSESFENLYEPIWINGEINPNNYYAHYVYKVVQLYGKNIKYWEIKNEPDYTYGSEGDKASNEEGNWWDNDPKPESLPNWRAPIQSYVRLLRISYEVIKKQYPDSYICVGGIGYLSFLDAILRNTDNPNGGTETDEYPLKGGAWFDCLSFHIYPMYYQKKWVGRDEEGNIDGFAYSRNSDNAANIVITRKNEFESLLNKYDYGTKYPQKRFLITETNIPHKAVGNYIGSQEAQRNYILKVAIECMKNGVDGIYPYSSWDLAEVSNAQGKEYDYMGPYKPLPETPSGQLRFNEMGIAWRTISNVLRDTKTQNDKLIQLSLPSHIKGLVLSKNTQSNIYVLWVETTEDMKENVSATYSFPSNLNVSKLYTKTWDNKIEQINGNSINLTGTPIFIKINENF